MPTQILRFHAYIHTGHCKSICCTATVVPAVDHAGVVDRGIASRCHGMPPTNALIERRTRASVGHGSFAPTYCGLRRTSYAHADATRLVCNFDLGQGVMNGFRRVSRRRNSVAPLLGTDYDSQSKLKESSVYHLISNRVRMKLLLVVTLGLSLMILAWPVRALRAAPKKRLRLGAREEGHFSIEGDRFYVDGEPTRLISCECSPNSKVL